jgi:hypothetical protein
MVQLRQSKYLYKSLLKQTQILKKYEDDMFLKEIIKLFWIQ